jgi:hypothetical protein
VNLTLINVYVFVLVNLGKYAITSLSRRNVFGTAQERERAR